MMLFGHMVSALDYVACSVGHERIENRASGEGVAVV
jgi:hypothetical protein